MTYPLSTHTAGDVISYVRRQFGDDASVQLLDSDILTWINMAQDEIARKLKNIQATSYTISVAGNDVYDVPPDVIQMESVYYNNVPLRATSQDWIQTQVGESMMDRGTPRYWWIWAANIHIYPVPEDSVTEIKVNYIKRPNDVVNAASSLQLPDAYYTLICEYVMSKAQELDENLQAAQISKQQFDTMIVEVTGLERNEIGSFLVVQEYEYD